MKAWLQSRGIHASNEWLLKPQVKGVTNKELIYKLWLNSDVHDNSSQRIVSKWLHQGENGGKGKVDSKIVLQVKSVRDVSESAYSQYTKLTFKAAAAGNDSSRNDNSRYQNRSNRLLRISLTDGHDEFVAAELQHLKELQINDLRPGTKVSLSNIEIYNNIALLQNASQISILGGGANLSNDNNYYIDALRESLGMDPEPEVSEAVDINQRQTNRATSTYISESGASSSISPFYNNPNKSSSSSSSTSTAVANNTSQEEKKRRRIEKKRLQQAKLLEELKKNKIITISPDSSGVNINTGHMQNSSIANNKPNPNNVKSKGKSKSKQNINPKPYVSNNVNTLGGEFDDDFMMDGDFDDFDDFMPCTKVSSSSSSSFDVAKTKPKPSSDSLKKKAPPPFCNNNQGATSTYTALSKVKKKEKYSVQLGDIEIINLDDWDEEESFQPCSSNRNLKSKNTITKPHLNTTKSNSFKNISSVGPNNQNSTKIYDNKNVKRIKLEPDPHFCFIRDLTSCSGGVVAKKIVRIKAYLVTLKSKFNRQALKVAAEFDDGTGRCILTVGPEVLLPVIKCKSIEVYNALNADMKKQVKTQMQEYLINMEGLMEISWGNGSGRLIKVLSAKDVTKKSLANFL